MRYAPLSDTHISSLPNVSKADLPKVWGCEWDTGESTCSVGDCVGIPFALDGAFHVYGLERNASDIGIYVDARPIRKLSATCLHQPLAIDIDRETMLKWMGLPGPETLPDVTCLARWTACSREKRFALLSSDREGGADRCLEPRDRKSVV